MDLGLSRRGHSMQKIKREDFVCGEYCFRLFQKKKSQYSENQFKKESLCIQDIVAFIKL